MSCLPLDWLTFRHLLKTFFRNDRKHPLSYVTLKLLWRIDALKSSWAMSRVNVQLQTSVLEISPVSVFRVNGGRGYLRNIGFSSTLVQLTAREDFSASTKLHGTTF
jgi:hypothetical protein